jgi:hypothetical protein
MEPVQILAICTVDGVDGYYLLFCTPDWRYVTSCFNETLEYTKRSPAIEFGHDVAEWKKIDLPNEITVNRWNIPDWLESEVRDRDTN